MSFGLCPVTKPPPQGITRRVISYDTGLSIPIESLNSSYCLPSCTPYVRVAQFPGKRVHKVIFGEANWVLAMIPPSSSITWPQPYSTVSTPQARLEGWVQCFEQGIFNGKYLVIVLFYCELTNVWMLAALEFSHGVDEDGHFVTPPCPPTPTIPLVMYDTESRKKKMWTWELAFNAQHRHRQRNSKTKKLNFTPLPPSSHPPSACLTQYPRKSNTYATKPPTSFKAPMRFPVNFR